MTTTRECINCYNYTNYDPLLNTWQCINRDEYMHKNEAENCENFKPLIDVSEINFVNLNFYDICKIIAKEYNVTDRCVRIYINGNGKIECRVIKRKDDSE